MNISSISLSTLKLYDYIISIEAEYLLKKNESNIGNNLNPTIDLYDVENNNLDLSIVIPTRNPNERQFIRCLNSVKKSILSRFKYEIIISDNDSTTSTAKNVSDLIKLDNLRYIQQPYNIGGIKNFNWCLSNAKGKWIHMLHSDDWIEPDFYEELLLNYDNKYEAPLRFCRANLYHEDTNIITSMFDENSEPAVLNNFIRKQVFSQRFQISATILKRSYLVKLGGYDENLGLECDWEFWARWVSQCPVFYSPKKLATYTLHSGSWTSDNSKKQTLEEKIYRLKCIKLRMLDYVNFDLRYEVCASFFACIPNHLIDYTKTYSSYDKLKIIKDIVSKYFNATVIYKLDNELIQLLVNICK